MSVAGRASSVGSEWYVSFQQVLRDPILGSQLKDAADGARLKPWTELLTAAVVRAGANQGWECAAKGSGHAPLPVFRNEFMTIDVVAFDESKGWREPVAAFELENRRRFDFIAYALWKACTVRTELAVLLCFRREPDQIAALIGNLQDQVLSQIKPVQEVLVAVGTRSSAGTFPDDYFRPFVWNADTSKLVSFLAARGETR